MSDNWNRKKFKTRNYDCQEETRYLRVKFVSKTGNEINKYATNKGRNFKQIHIHFRPSSSGATTEWQSANIEIWERESSK